MFDIGFLELLLIGVVGLLVLGPERLPMAARTVGMWVGRIKRSVSGIQREINEQLRTEEVRQKINEHKKSFDENVERVNREVEGVADNDRPSTPADNGPDTPASEAKTPEQRLDDALNKARQPASSADAPSKTDDPVKNRVYVANAPADKDTDSQ
ncbi:Sec-independent protein translocase protein TatB [Halomonas halocynthiae]|uniref:Sec-independent protein translocase protein TatB n=1 Tax=Halomonas halocynthiae TaxID=176290 RepID=UPI00040FF0C5|nr:Sec-independent protein translocase protein TatB [Halomonas halocynthiae]